MTILVPVWSREDIGRVVQKAHEANKAISDWNARKPQHKWRGPRYEFPIVARNEAGEWFVGLGCQGYLSEFKQDFPNCLDFCSEQATGRRLTHSVPAHPSLICENEYGLAFACTPHDHQAPAPDAPVAPSLTAVEREFSGAAITEE